jgi:hypothetical protein
MQKVKERYYECHVTMEGDRKTIQGMVEDVSMPRGWKFSAIDGDPVGKCYATKHTNEGEYNAITACRTGAEILRSMGANVVREKVEFVVYDMKFNRPSASRKARAQ